MIRKPTWILLAVFAVLVIAAVLLQKYKPEDTDIAPTATFAPPQPSLYDLGSTVVNRITFEAADGNALVVERATSADSWIIAGDTEGTSDSFAIGSIVGQLLALKAMTTFDLPPAPEAVGLVIPAYTITMVTSTGEQIVTKVGDQTAVGTGYYVQVDDGAVMVVELLALDTVLVILDTPPLLPTPTSDITATPESGFTPSPAP